MSESSPKTTGNQTRRVVGALFGIFFIGIALAILATIDDSNLLGPLAAAVVVGGLGIDLLVSSLRGRRSLLSRIGPLP